jgi:pimeloyl-ACP methyl ester carboxylesterase
MNDSPHPTASLAVRTVGKGPPLLLFHGGMGSWNHWTRNLSALATRFTVHAVDLPGYGGSHTVAKSVGKDDYIDLVIADIRPIIGEEPFRLAGFSFGGVVAARVAARLGEQVVKLSLMGVGGFGPLKKLGMRPIPDASAGERARREVLRHNLGLLMIADPAKVTEESIDFYADNYRDTRYDGRGFSVSTNVVTSLEHIRCPVQFIYGDRDALAHTDLQRRADIVRSLRPDAQFVVLPGAGHWVQYEAAEEVNRLLLEFL